jgi:hypothetical protein
MTRNIENNHFFLVSALFLITVLASVPAAAWGPYAQAVIAEESAATLGQPKGTGGPVYLDTSVAPKAFEYSDRAYVKLDPAFTVAMDKLGGRGVTLPQILAWGTAQVSEASGDRALFGAAPSPWERWLLELMVDANLMHGRWEPDYSHILGGQGVSCRTELLAGASKLYCQGRKLSAPFSRAHALQRAEMQAFAMLSEQVIIADPHFQANAARVVPPRIYQPALDESVAAATAYLAFGHGGGGQTADAGGGHSFPVYDAPLILLSKLGNILVTTNDAAISCTEVDGVTSFRFSIVTSRCNTIARDFLEDTADNPNEVLTIRSLARMLLDAMQPDFQARTFIDN